MSTELTESIRRFQLLTQARVAWVFPFFFKMQVLRDPGPALGAEARIVASNHRSIFDHFLIALSLKRKTFESGSPLRFIAKTRLTGLLAWPIIRGGIAWFYRRNVCIPLEEWQGGAKKALDCGHRVFIYPSGRTDRQRKLRGDESEIGEFKPGIVRISRENGNPSIWLVATRVTRSPWSIRPTCTINWAPHPVVIPEDLSEEEACAWLHDLVLALYLEAEAVGRGEI